MKSPTSRVHHDHGTLQDMLGPRTAIVKSSNGTVFQVPSTSGSMRTNFGLVLALR